MAKVSRLQSAIKSLNVNLDELCGDGIGAFADGRNRGVRGPVLQSKSRRSDPSGNGLASARKNDAEEQNDQASGRAAV